MLLKIAVAILCVIVAVFVMRLPALADVTIRPYESHDLDAAHALIERLLPFRLQPSFFEQIGKVGSNSTCFVAVLGDDMIGVVVLHVILAVGLPAQDSFAELSLARKSVYLSAICVSPDYRRRGIASRLLEMTVKWAALQNADLIFLHVQRDNAAARKLYERNGFEEKLVRADYYGATQDAVVYARLLR
eukprot:TRINITY_DN264_c1_g1_i1.p1 TRINITY_DN264_c1_g1~~TRINITY_DN264_c1_g1_i1.p1  ORF type:complete len:189 (+),score=20.94 TRINITY_DN264_c1_g1_i1:87-653(+)